METVQPRPSDQPVAIPIRPQLRPDATLADVIAELHRRDVEQVQVESVLEVLTNSPHQIFDRHGRPVLYRRPERRFRQFGSKAELTALAQRFGLDTSKRNDTCEALIRRLWSVPGIRRVMPGAVGWFAGPGFGLGDDERVAS